MIQQSHSWAYIWKTQFKKIHADFPGGPVVKHLPANVGDMDSIHETGGFCMPRGNWATPQLQSSPCLLQLEKAHLQQWRPSTAKINKFF